MKLTRLLLLFFGLSFTALQAQDIEKQKAKLKLSEEEKLTGPFATLHKNIQERWYFQIQKLQDKARSQILYPHILLEINCISERLCRIRL